MMWLTDEQAQSITQHALQAAPHEACGLIGGRGSRAVEVTPVANIAAHPETTYYMEPAALVQTLLDFERRGLDLIGIYHSHPQGGVIPSPDDIRQAHYPDAVYLIAGVHQHSVELAAWRIHAGHVDRITLHLGPTPPEISQNEEPLSKIQQSVLILSAALAFLLLIVISVTLLPPAPPIP